MSLLSFDGVYMCHSASHFHLEPDTLNEVYYPNMILVVYWQYSVTDGHLCIDVLVCRPSYVLNTDIAWI